MHEGLGVRRGGGETQAFIERVFEEHVYLLGCLPELGSNAGPAETRAHTHMQCAPLLNRRRVCERGHAPPTALVTLDLQFHLAPP